VTERSLPAGVVTFLFSDVEGSTRLLESDQVRTGRALAEHHEIFEQAVSDAGGVIFETVGDAVYAAFATAAAGISASAVAQRGLAAHDWGDGPALRVRIAVHTGPVESRGEHYFGAPLFRCARLQALAHGGQTLVSAATARALDGDLPLGVSLIERGRHRLKDLGDPEDVHELILAEGSREVRPLRAVEANPNNLPVALTSFLGRESELATIGTLLERERILTLLGPGGTGKTRLALEAADRALPHYHGGAWFVDLSTVRNADRMIEGIASTLDVRSDGEGSLEAGIVGRVSAEPTLLVLDNLEQIVDAAAPVARLLGGAPPLQVIVTSRIPLRIRGEREVPIDPLGLDLSEAETVNGRPPAAVRLFLDRAHSIRPDLEPTPEIIETITQICRRLDGLPLAIELAAARVRLFSPSQLLARLEHRLPLLTGGERDRPERQQTLRAAIAWSEELLDDREKLVFRRLGVFEGGFDLAAAVAVAGLENADDVFDTVSALVERSLIRTQEAGDDVRFSMLETIREYALERLAFAGEEADARDRHVSYFCSFAALAFAELVLDDQARWLRRIGDELPNLASAIGHGLASGAPTGAAMVGALLGRYYLTRFEHGLAKARLEPLLLATANARPAERAQLLNQVGNVRGDLGDTEGALPLYEEALELFRTAGNEQAAANVAANIGSALGFGGKLDEAIAILGELVDAPPAQADEHLRLSILQNLAQIAGLKGDLELAARAILEAVEVSRPLSPYERCVASSSAAQILAAARRFEDADRCLAEMDEAVGDLGSDSVRAVTVLTRAEVLYERGRLDEARQTFRQGLASLEAWDTADSYWVSGKMTLAALEVESGDPAAGRAALSQVGLLPLDWKDLPTGRAAFCDIVGLLAASEDTLPLAARLFDEASAIRDSIHARRTGRSASLFERAEANVRASGVGPLAGDLRDVVEAYLH